MQGACIRFIASVSRELFDEYAAAERYCREAPGYSLVLLRDFAFRLVGLVNERAGIRSAGNLNEQIRSAAFIEAVPESTREALDFLRLNGNIGAHPAEFRKSTDEFIALALASLRSAHGLAVWFYRGEMERSGTDAFQEPAEFLEPDAATSGDIHRAAIMDGDARACYRVGLALLERGRVELEKNKIAGRKGEPRRDGRTFVFVPEDFADALYWFRKADRGHDGETGGHAGARHQMGLLIRSGLGVERDEQEGEALIYSAAEQGHVEALCELGGLYYHGSINFERDYARAFACFERAARHDHPGALTALTRMYKEGLGVSRDLFKAFEFAERAAHAGFPSARYSLGLLYMEGRGVKRSTRKAFDWFVSAARDGSEEAALALYRLRKKGAEQLLTHGEALRWLGRALRGRHAEAAYEMGRLRLEDESPDYYLVVKHYSRALEWGAGVELLEGLREELPAAVGLLRASLLRGDLSEQRYHACTMLAANFDGRGFPARNNPFE